MTYEDINKNAEKIAAAINEIPGFDYSSINALVWWIEENFDVKINIFCIDLSKTRVSGAVYPQSANNFQILIDSTDYPGRQRFTACHELGHILRNIQLRYGFFSNDFDMYSKHGEERFCNRFAAAFLMPAKLFAEKWMIYNDQDLLKKARIADFFKVSADAVHFRAIELGLI